MVGLKSINSPDKWLRAENQGRASGKSEAVIRLFNSEGTKTDYLKEGSAMRWALVMVLIFTAASISLGQKQKATGDETTKVVEVIRRLDQERIQAQVGADRAALDRIYADDFIGIGPSGTVRTKPQVILDFTSGDLKFQSITTDEVQVRVYGNTAVETGLSIMNGRDKGKIVPRDNRFTRVWVKQQGRWRLVANHYSLLVR